MPLTDSNLIADELTAWYQKPLGISLKQLENEELRQILKRCFGRYLIQIGGHQPLSALESSFIPYRFIVINNFNPSNDSFMQASYDALPLQNDSVDTIVHWHSLETHAQPEIILAESWRVLAPDGRMIILGFNPWSLWGIKHYLSPNQFLSTLYFHSAQKICKWAHHVGGEIITAKSFCFRPPTTNKKLMDKLQWLEAAGLWLWPHMGGVFLLEIQKRTIPLTPIKLTWPWQAVEVNKGLSPTEGSIKGSIRSG